MFSWRLFLTDFFWAHKECTEKLEVEICVEAPAESILVLSPLLNLDKSLKDFADWGDYLGEPWENTILSHLICEERSPTLQ